MLDHIKRGEVQPCDEAWIVIDRDEWTEEQLARLHQWSNERTNHGFALSNPNFEYWLILHFEDGDNADISVKPFFRYRGWMAMTCSEGMPKSASTRPVTHRGCSTDSSR